MIYHLFIHLQHALDDRGKASLLSATAAPTPPAVTTSVPMKATVSEVEGEEKVKSQPQTTPPQQPESAKSVAASTSFAPVDAPSKDNQWEREPLSAKRSLELYPTGHGTAPAASLSSIQATGASSTAFTTSTISSNVHREKELVYRTRSEQAPPCKAMPSLPCMERLLPIGGPVQPSIGSKDRFDRFDRDTSSRQDRRLPFDPSVRLTQIFASRGAGSTIEIPSLERLLPVGPMPTR